MILHVQEDGEKSIQSEEYNERVVERRYKSCQTYIHVMLHVSVLQSCQFHDQVRNEEEVLESVTKTQMDQTESLHCMFTLFVQTHKKVETNHVQE